MQMELTQHLVGPMLTPDDLDLPASKIAQTHFKWTGRRVSLRRVRRLMARIRAGRLTMSRLD